MIEYNGREVLREVRKPGAVFVSTVPLTQDASPSIVRVVKQDLLNLLTDLHEEAAKTLWAFRHDEASFLVVDSPPWC